MFQPSTKMIRPATENDFYSILEIINDAATAYKGKIPADRYHEPYMSDSELRGEMADGIHFYCYCNPQAEVVGVMGIQHKLDVDLIRHAYVRTSVRNKGVGGLLLQHLCETSRKPIFIGTWADAVWAIGFYQKHGFRLVTEEEKNLLLKKYWSIPDRQVETSVVLADETFYN